MPIAAHETVTGLPALERAHIDAGEFTGPLEPRTGGMGLLDVADHDLAIFQADHSSAPSPKTAESFFESTSKAAVSASALSLRFTSRSSSLMRLWALRVCCGLARVSSGAVSAAVALCRHFSNSAGNRPFSRH